MNTFMAAATNRRRIIIVGSASLMTFSFLALTFLILGMVKVIDWFPLKLLLFFLLITLIFFSLIRFFPSTIDD